MRPYHYCWLMAAVFIAPHLPVAVAVASAVLFCAAAMIHAYKEQS